MALPTLITDIWLAEPRENKLLLFQATKFVLFFFFFFLWQSWPTNTPPLSKKEDREFLRDLKL